jgi:hypothetical protein
VKLELFTNATVVDDAMKFVEEKKQKRQNVTVTNSVTATVHDYSEGKSVDDENNYSHKGPRDNDPLSLTTTNQAFWIHCTVRW